MTSIDYSIFSKRTVPISEVHNESFDIFISPYNSSERVRELFSRVDATSKTWIVHHEYEFKPSDLPATDSLIFCPEGVTPVIFWRTLLSGIVAPKDRSQVHIGIDITGMMRLHLMILPLILRIEGFSRAIFFYSDPMSYSSGSTTKFTKGPVESVDVVPGLEGCHQSATKTTDVLIIGAGYDHALIQAAAESKRSANHYLMLGLPSLQPHMYQESVLRIGQASEAIRDYRHRSFLFAPTSDPFVTAQIVSDHVRRLKMEGRADNVYLSPVGAKPQVLGFSWYFLCEARNSATSMLFPVTRTYEKETSRGIGAIHRFEMELDMIQLP